MLVVVPCRASLSISARSKSARIVLADGLGAPFLEEYDEGSQSIDELIKVWGNDKDKVIRVDASTIDLSCGYLSGGVVPRPCYHCFGSILVTSIEMKANAVSLVCLLGAAKTTTGWSGE
ncbi:unnamed protein product, partial [Mesorhabditis belari]|uniref:Uncharacterized protein n=1 Tax=Mesorhabditis belari TaxID=2138241 RepID=A0AAF3FB69_9BILA